MRRAFTLTELMIVIAIMAILAGLGLSAMAGATNLAREHRTEAQIKKIDMLVSEKWESYRTRSLAVSIPKLWGVDNRQYLDVTDPVTRVTTRVANPNYGGIYYTDGRTAATIRLNGLRDLMRMELPDRITDITDPPAVLFTRPAPYDQSVIPQVAPPAVYKSYRRLAARFAGPNWQTTWTVQYQGAECLYLILSVMSDGDKKSLDYFDSTEIGDTDGDGMMEILDGWGTPIEFLRWAPGYVSTSTAPVSTMQDANWNAAPDPFDPAKIDPRWQLASALVKPYALFPLIVSAGRDKQIDIAMRLIDTSGNQFHYVNTTPLNDPYFIPNNVPTQQPLGTPIDANGDGPNWPDNITNHAQNGQ